MILARHGGAIGGVSRRDMRMAVRMVTLGLIDLSGGEVPAKDTDARAVAHVWRVLHRIYSVNAIPPHLAHFVRR